MQDGPVRKDQAEFMERPSEHHFEKHQQTRIILIYNARIMSILILLASLVLVALASCWIFRK